MTEHAEPLEPNNPIPLHATNGATPPTPAPDIAAAKPALDWGKALLKDSPTALIVADTERVLIEVVKKTGDFEFFRAHATVRLTLDMVTPGKDEIGAPDYALLPHMAHVLGRHKIEPYLVTLYPVCVDTRPLTIKLVMVKHPRDGLRWDSYNLSKKRCLDAAVDRWIAMRREGKTYAICPPHLSVEFPDPVFPDYEPHEWLDRSLGAAGLIICNEDHEVFKKLEHR